MYKYLETIIRNKLDKGIDDKMRKAGKIPNEMHLKNIKTEETEKK